MIEDILHDVALSYLLEREPVGASEEVVQSFPPGIDLARTVARFNLAFKRDLLLVIILNDVLEFAETF